MPTIISHAVVGLAAGRVVSSQKLPVRFWLLAAIMPMLPDADVITLALGIPYDHFLGHRGFFHSLFFASIVSPMVVSLILRLHPAGSKRWWRFVLFFFVLTASHGILDAFTNGGLGIALLAPFDNTRYFFPFRPIEVSPIGIGSFFSEWGIKVLISELLWLWLPAGAMLGGRRIVAIIGARRVG